MESRSLFGRYGVAVGLATAIALLAALGGSWGTAFGQTVPNLPAPTAEVAPAPTEATQPEVASAPVETSLVEVAQPSTLLPSTGEPAASSEIPIALAIAGLAALGAGLTTVRLSSRKR
jgi:hypothetical protein